MLGLAVFADGFFNVSNGTHSSFLSWQAVGLRVAALFLRLEVDDVPLDNVGMALDFDFPALLAE